jgi:cell division protease FtsH
MMSPEDKRRTAYHEAGHAIVGMLTQGADPVRKVSIIPRGLALGVTFSAPESDRFNYREPEVYAKIKVALGGRAAEEVVLRRDEHRRRIRHPAAHRDRTPDGRPLGHERRDRARCRDSARRSGALLPGVSEVSPDTQKTDRRRGAPHRRESHREVVELLQQNRSRLDSLVNALLEHETLDEDDAYAAAGVARTATQAADPYAAAARSRNGS